jgi:hypothetical protein
MYSTFNLWQYLELFLTWAVESGKPCPEKNSQNRRQTVLFSIFSYTSRGELPSRARAPLPPRPYMALRAQTPHSFLAGLQPTTGVSPETPTLVWDSSGPNHGEGRGGGRELERCRILLRIGFSLTNLVKYRQHLFNWLHTLSFQISFDYSASIRPSEYPYLYLYMSHVYM